MGVDFPFVGREKPPAALLGAFLEGEGYLSAVVFLVVLLAGAGVLVLARMVSMVACIRASSAWCLSSSRCRSVSSISALVSPRSWTRVISVVRRAISARAVAPVDQ